ncbi:MAG: S9 family peptidase [Planctomycetota bacterium]|jgi:dipeptidyl aminopeptidase/acylaminoacyl peptidase
MKICHLMTAAALTLGVAVGIPPAAAQDETPLIAREVLFGNPVRASPRLSPDGSKLSFLAPVDGVLNVWVGPVNDPDTAQPITHDMGQGIRVYFWAYTDRHVLYLQDEDGDENWRLFCVDIVSGLETALTPDMAKAPDGTPTHEVSARIQHVSHNYPRDIVVALNDRDERFHDLYVVNIDTGELVQLQENDGFLGFHTDDDFNVRFAMKLMPDGGNEILRFSDEGTWETFTKITMEDLFTTGVIDFDESGENVYMVDSRGRNTAAVTSVNVATGATQTLAKDRDADISGGVLIHPTDKRILAVSSTYKRKDWQVIDKSVKGDFKYLRRLVDGDMSILSQTVDDSQWIVAYEVDDGPVRYYRYDRAGQSAEFLFTDRPQLDDLPLAKMHTEVIKSRDRQNLISYYTLPVSADPRGKGKPNKPQPMVVWVHGGPWWRDFWGYEPIHQWLSNRGYAVLSVNYRGSTGFGKKFVNAGNREWGGKMQEDLLDAVAWAVKKKIADPDRVAIMGGSYGGYATLVGLTFTPDTFACGVDIVGPSNLVSFLQSIPPYWEPTVELWATRVGDYRTEEGRSFLAQRSPMTFVDQISKPLLIGQGANDPRVKRSESDEFVETMQQKGVPVTYVLYPDEGHGFARPGNRLSFFAVAEQFLADHLGGQAEPIGDSLADSSIKIPVGGERIDGVAGGFINR